MDLRVANDVREVARVSVMAYSFLTFACIEEAGRSQTFKF